MTENPALRALMQMGESEAIAWSYAAMVAAGAPLDEMWQSDPGLFVGDAPHVLQMLQGNSHFGINGLQACGMTTVRTYPSMKRWLQ